MKKRLIARGAVLCACAMLMNGCAALAEEKRLGDYIYVPAMQVHSAGGMTSLRVEGLALDGASGEPTVDAFLAGAEFGVYVISGSGKVTPWANPLYPSEQMRIRSGEEEMRFTLPQGAEYYLRQESAPQGYLFDSETLIPVTDGEIVVRNAMAGRIEVSVQDSLGIPLEGVVLTARGEDGSEHTLTTDEAGTAVLLCEREQAYEIAQSKLPQGVFAAQQVSVGTQVFSESSLVRVDAKMAQRTQLTYVHPAAGSVALAMSVEEVDENAQTVQAPLERVEMVISGGMLDEPVSIVTDKEGKASASLIEGTYDVRLTYKGKEDVIMPLEAGQMIISSGTTTYIELSAVRGKGRIVVLAESERRMEGGSVTLRSEESKKTYGPYALDAEGMAVSEPLAAGTYVISEFVAPKGMQIGDAVSGETSAQDPFALHIALEAGKAAYAEVEMLTREQQSFVLLSQRLDERAQKQEARIEGGLNLELIDMQGSVIAQLDAKNGQADVEALSGTYALRMDARKAQKLGVQQTSEVFSLPSQEEAVVFPASEARMIIASVDENGEPVTGACYVITDSSGKRSEAESDADGLAVSGLLVPGEITIETKRAPEGHDAAQTAVSAAMAGEAAHISMTHERYGSMQLNVMLKSLDVNGRESLSALQGVEISLFRLDEDGAGMKDTGIALVSDESGMAQVQLAPGEYVARAQQDGGEYREPQALRFIAENMQSLSGELVFMDVLGGVRAQLTGGSLNDEELAQVRFKLLGSDAKEYDMTMQDGAFYAGGLVSGTYVLRQTQIPQGFTLAAERTVSVSGGEVTEVDVPLEEYAELTVSKTGLTFDDALKTYIVPLSGEYGVYTMADGEMKPYPSAAAQKTIWANITPEQEAQGRKTKLKLPAAVDGTTYYLHEIGSAEGFGLDDTYYEVNLRAGENQMLSCAVSSDRGFFTLEQTDAATGMHLPGGRFELEDAVSGETVLAFEMGETPYRNTMAVPVGRYLLRHVQAADGYALSLLPDMELIIEPYLTRGGTVTDVQMKSAPLPEKAELDLIRDIYAAREQGLTLVTVDTGALMPGETLLAPAAEIRIGAAGDERSNILSVVISGTGDSLATPYQARVEYCLSGGGWQPSDARMTGVLTGPTAVSLADVKDDVSAVRVTYINAQTGEERVLDGFTPGQIVLSVQASAVGDVNMQAEASFGGQYVYRTISSEPVRMISRSQSRSIPFVMQADGVFTTVCAGRDGRISGIAFFDEDADGVMDRNETGRYAGLTVSLLDQNGDEIDSCRTGSDGSYAFSAVSGGSYMLKFDAGESVVFSSGSLYSAHVISGVEDARYGRTGEIRIDGDHTDYRIQVGCIYASAVQGSVVEQLMAAETAGYAGLGVELRPTDADEEDEPFITTTDGMGTFAFSRILPGRYEISMQLPEGYLCSEEEGGRMVRQLQLTAGDTFDLGQLLIQKEASVAGRVLIDDDGDGVIAQGAAALSGVRVVLLSAQDGHTDRVAETITDANGAYRFEALAAGEYSVLFELSGQWAFTRYGEDSCVYGAVSQSGSTRHFALEPGQEITAMDAGVTIPAQMMVSVFQDTQFDGEKGTYEEMLEGVSISLIRIENGEDAEEITYKTNQDGVVVFAGVSPGEYVIAYQMPGQWRATKQVDPRTTSYHVSSVPQSSVSSGRSEPFMLSMGQSGLNMYIGAMLSGSISGVAYYDSNADAQMDPTETACTDVKVELLSADGTLLDEAEPDEDGSYAFEGLAPGRYRVRFTADDGCGFSGTERTVARGSVQESDEPVSTTRLISVANGGAADSVDAGVVRLGKLSGVIWEDRSADCMHDADESGMAGVSVSLMNSTARSIIHTTTTDGQGRFAFDRLRPGTYVLRVDAPTGHVFSGAIDGSPLPLESVRSGRGYSAAFTLLGGANVQDVGFGVLTQGVIRGVIWQDANYDGVMESREEGLRGASVTVSDASGSVVKTTTTIRSGEFMFEEMMPGEYTLSVTLPEGYVFTTENGASIAPADADRSASMALEPLAMGGNISDILIGALKPASVGGVAWYDQDDDGRRQTEDTPVSGVRVVLEMTGGEDSGRTMETVTGADGTYRFDAVMPGRARLTFELEEGHVFARRASGSRRVSVAPMADSLTATTDEILVTSGEEIGYLDVGVVGAGMVSGRIWEDREYDGKPGKNESSVAGAKVELIDALAGRVAAETETDENGVYAFEFVRKGSYSVRVTLPEDMIFTRSGSGVIADVDSDCASTGMFELEMGEGRESLNLGAIAPAHIAGRVVVDENEDGIYGESEAGFAGAVVTAMQGGTAVATVRTQQDGSYAFDMLRPGAYRLRFALDDEALFASGCDLRMENPDAPEGETGEYAMQMGESLDMQPVMVVRAAAIGGGAWMDTDVSGTRDGQEMPMTQVKAELLDRSGRTIAEEMVDAQGRYLFSRLRSGDYHIRFTLEPDMLFTDYPGTAEGSSVPVVEGNVGVSSVVALAQGEKQENVNVGGILPGEIGDTVWLDKDGNGLQDYREPLIPHVSLTLLKVAADGTMTEAATAQSDKYGYYSFELLRPGTYVLRLNAKPGDTLTYHFGEPLGEIDSDLDPDSAMSEPFKLASGQKIRNMDVGLTEHED